MVNNYIPFFLGILLSDWVTFDKTRDLLFSFLLSKRNRKKAKEIHRAQSKKDRFTMSYIKEYAI